MKTNYRLAFPRLDEEVKKRGTVRAFARYAGIHEMTYYRLQTYGNPTMTTIRKLLDYTGMTFEEAFGEKIARPALARETGRQ